MDLRFIGLRVPVLAEYHCVVALGKLLTLVCLSHQEAYFSIGQGASVIFVNENENGEKRENNEFVNEN